MYRLCLMKIHIIIKQISCCSGSFKSTDDVVTDQALNQSQHAHRILDERGNFSFTRYKRFRCLSLNFLSVKKMRCKLFIYVGLKQGVMKMICSKTFFSTSSTIFPFRCTHSRTKQFLLLQSMFCILCPSDGIRQFFFRRWPSRWGYHSSTFTNTLGREKILIALSISDSFLSSSAFVVFTRSVSTLTGSAFNWARSSVWSEREIN